MNLRGSEVTEVVRHPALFLDRDGVINIDHGYVYKIESFEFVDGIFTLCEAFQSRGYKIVVVTNQAGIAYGYYTEQQFAHLTEWMTEQFLARGIAIEGVYYSPNHPTKGNPPYRKVCNRRKPAPGMLLEAAEKHNLDVAKSCMIGDKPSDMEAARRAGVGRRILLRSDYHQSAAPDSDATELADSLFTIAPA